MADFLTDGVVGAVSSVVNNVIERLFPDPVKQAEARLELVKLQQSGELAALAADVQIATNQTNVNLEEAKSASVFVSGWRPFVGWVCGCGFAIQVLGPLLEWGALLAGHPAKFPDMDYGLMGTTLLGMLGLGGMRTFEKWKGVEGNR
jgi:hypothetical protein